ncbi:hypothetical protein KZ483_13375 [Paenibacillus sp. sptzw28]|uniref:putative amidoligase domain-containing protein n=1 Tax=Paenibacillus sp. sptzw28 TaxID=715179 RepID=UPI001C6E4393|nr:hypothetical protein [Paenibacillus sp. sptzw28]QYR23787.1 hypothetical protein KZ483_13375 [Paenibacillus sp. sptzw28]
MAGKVWFWSGERAAAKSALAPQAWREGIPSADDAVIVCGGAKLPPIWRDAGEPLVLNARAAAFAALDKEEIRRRLRRAGVAVAGASGDETAVREAESGKSWRDTRRYAVALFHLQPIAVQRRSPVGTGIGINAAASARIIRPSDSLYRRLSMVAVRALYAAGLDFGIVEVQTDDVGRCSVVRVSLPAEDRLAGGIWAEAVRGFKAETSEAAVHASREGGAVLLGADPEFLLLGGGGKVVPAARYLEGGHGAGCDAVVVGGRVMHPVAELRPAPAKSPGELAANIRRLLSQAAARIPDGGELRWAAGGMPVPGFALGGHIHLSGVRLTGRLLRQLDSYLALPLAMIESAGERDRRPRYGGLGDFRLQSHGGFEYRTPPSWLASPLAAKAAFALALLCARESGTLSYRPSEDERIVDAYYAGDRETLRSRCLERLAESMEATPSYRELAGYIEPLFEAARKGRTWDVSADIRKKWRTAPFV